MGRLVGQIKPGELIGLARTPGMHHDGGGLYLRVPKPPEGEAFPTASWVLRYMLDKRARTMGLGPYPDIRLADARELAAEARRLKALGQDPIEARNAERDARRRDANKAKALTFRQCAERYIRSHDAGWKNAKHGKQWGATLSTYAYPLIGSMPVDEVDTAAVLRVLQQEVEADGQKVRFWEGKTVTAVRVKDRISKVLSWATAMGYRQGDNPAAWDRLQHLLPHKSSVAEEEHQPALPYTRIAEFISVLRGREGLAALALEFTILTAARGGQVRFARRREIDWNARVWTAPAENVKGKKGGGREHRVALSEQAITLLKSVLDGREGEPDDFIFPGGKPGKPMSDATLNAVIKRMNEKKVEWVDPKQGNRPVVPHGFRSTFDDYATGVLRFQTEAVEAALAHVVKDKTQAAYKRDDLLETRFELMQAWANFCDGKAGANVTPFPQASAA